MDAMPIALVWSSYKSLDSKIPMNEEMMLPISKPEGVDTVALDVLITLSAPRVQCSESAIKLITII